MTEDGHDLARLWAEHRAAPYPASFRGVEVDGVDLVLLDAEAAGLVGRELEGVLDDLGVALLRACVEDLDKVVPLIGEASCAAYFDRLRTITRMAAVRGTPAAT
ncbi:hypothetical protein [Streptacidiphilus jiangxiensis]|nr:hypothetical protein [Streptacidiphilus jiangxiensis]